MIPAPIGTGERNFDGVIMPYETPESIGRFLADAPAEAPASKVIAGFVTALGYLVCSKCAGRFAVRAILPTTWKVIWRDSLPHAAENCDICKLLLQEAIR